MINARDTVTLCIGGRLFITRRSTLFRVPHSRLSLIAERHPELTNANQNESSSNKAANNSAYCFNNNVDNATISSSIFTSNSPVYYFDRDPEIFRFVLDFYRTDESYISACCMPAYMRYDEEKRTKKTLFKDCFEDIDSFKNLVNYCQGWKKMRYRLWLFFDHPSSSMAAKAWALILLLLMITSVTLYCLSTHLAFRVPVVFSNNSINISTLLYNRSSICSNLSFNQKLHKDCTTEPIHYLIFLDVALNIIFSIEFLIKLMLAPDKRKFLTDIVSIIDIGILSSYWVYASVFYHIRSSPYPTTLWILNLTFMSQALRILRIFKVSKISRGLRVLILTIKKSIPELVLLAFLLMNGIFFFSCLIYAAEYWVEDTFISIPHAFWWSIVTLTTVGYGDSYPKHGPGYFVGSVTAICGCILTGLAIPIIGNNFNTYYMYMKNQIKEDKYIKDLQKDLVSLSSTLKTSNIKKLAALRDGQSHQCNMVMKRKITTPNCPLTTPVLSLDIANASLKMIAKGAHTKKKKSFYRFINTKYKEIRESSTSSSIKRNYMNDSTNSIEKTEENKPMSSSVAQPKLSIYNDHCPSSSLTTNITAVEHIPDDVFTMPEDSDDNEEDDKVQVFSNKKIHIQGRREDYV